MSHTTHFIVVIMSNHIRKYVYRISDIYYSIYVFPDMVRHYDDNEMSRVRHIDSLKYV